MENNEKTRIPTELGPLQEEDLTTGGYTEVDPRGEQEEVPVDEAISRSEAELAELKKLARSGAVTEGPALRPGKFRAKRRGEAYTVDNNAPYEDPEVTLRRKAEIDIYQSITQKRILKGRVLALKTLERSASPLKTTFVLTQHGPVLVAIPVLFFANVDWDEFLANLQKNKPDATMNTAINLYFSSRQDAEIDFTIVSEFDDEIAMDLFGSTDEKVFIGSRVDAMERLKVYHWYGVDRNTKEFVLQKGTKVEARVIAANKIGIRVEAFGVETLILNKELAYSYTEDAREKYSAGDKVWVILDEVNRGNGAEDNYPVSFTASVRAAKKDPRIPAMTIFSEGSTFVGTIYRTTYPDEHNPNRRPAVYVEIPEYKGVQVCCPFPTGPIAPVKGSRCFVRITNRDMATRRLYGVIYHISAPYDM